VSPKDMTVPATVGTEVVAATDGALHLRVQSRTRRPIPGPPSGLAQSP
jgi:hypothetical protein